ncbi:CocE/NonD family hydrolase [Pseudanabaena sp. PCC 6802]|uniref:CocE/NonD family hydrolase n=1 Tax=Pseudanabaena sp. PCC 6802 TaxID=118173 RepID=UPI00034DF390|nr:CocE/NonD family hydrolase [Pseudanabaena sp. PCC 6802]
MPNVPRAFHAKVNIERQVPIPMRDGINLTADIYRPKGVDTPLPVLLMRLPYGRAIASTVTYAHPSWYAMQGYIVVIQDVRGCGTSAGEFYPFRHEYEDGYDTVRWCAQQLAGTNGKVGMYGFSYQGVTQFQAAVMQPPGLVTICPAMASADFYHGWFYFGGALCLDFVLGWALQLTQNRAQFLKLEPQATNLFNAQKRLVELLETAPLESIDVLKQEPLGQFFFDWIRSDRADSSYWQELNPLSRFERYDLPALHIAGWADLFIAGTIDTYIHAQQHTKQLQKLVVGPWQHMPWLRQVGEIDFGETAVSQIDALQVDWFDYWLKGIDNGIVDRAPVRVFLMGKNQWSDLPNWPGSQSDRIAKEIEDTTNEQLDFYLHPNHQLKNSAPPTDFPPDLYVYDPRIPNPSTPYGPYDQRLVHQRWDVLLYQSDVLVEELDICGTPEFLLYAATTAPDTDWIIKLMDIYPDGQQMLISMGVLRAKYRHAWHEPINIEADLVLDYAIALRPTCHCFLIGHRLGVAIASAAFPLVERHPNTQQPPRSALVSNYVEAVQQVHHSRNFPSCLRLPKLLV